MKGSIFGVSRESNSKIQLSKDAEVMERGPYAYQKISVGR